ncbi:MAG: hypothetical protein VX944_11230 [Myxococcota bacterium]|nr:hypothetical protein [Myxococcota bacterium]
MHRNQIFNQFVVLAVGLLGWALPAIAAPSDIALLQSLTKSQLEARSVEDVRTQLQAVALERTETIAAARRYPASLRSSNPLVRKYILAEVANSMPADSLFSTDSDLQRTVNLALKIMSGRLSEKALAYAAFQPAPKPPEKRTKPRPLSESATVTSQRPLAIDLSKSVVAEDQGMVGASNGILDPGETATLRLQFTNTSSRRLMSTSVYVRRLSECLYTSQALDSEIQLPELAPDASAAVNLKVFASSECSGRTGKVYMEARDTHEFASKPLAYTLTLSLSDAAEATLVDVRIDRDDYGHSEPAGDARIQPNDQVEVSASFALRKPGYSFAEQTILGPAGASEASHQTGRIPFRAMNGSYVSRMHDDLDLTFPGKTELLAKLRPIAEAYGWTEPGDGRVYVAVDTRFGTKESAAAAAKPAAEPTYTFDSAALQQHLAKHLNIEVNRTSTPPSEGRIAVGSVDGFRFEIDDPGPLMVKLQEIELQVTQPTPPAPSSYAVRHYIELPIFWEHTLNPTCSLSTPRSARAMSPIDMTVSYSDVPIGSRILVNGLGIAFSANTETEAGDIELERVLMKPGKALVELRIIDPDGTTICQETQRITETMPIAKRPPTTTPATTVPELPLATLTTNGHFGGLGGQDVTATIGRSFGLVVSGGSIGAASTGSLGLRATQLLGSDPNGIQVSITESFEYGRRLDSHVTRGAIYLSFHRRVGLNAGVHVIEQDENGEMKPSLRLGIGGFFGAVH